MISQRLRAISPILAQKQTEPFFVPFGAWSPDLADYLNEGATEAKNVIPTIDGYRPMPDLQAFSSNALTARCQGAIAAQRTSGDQTVFAGDATKLYKMVDQTFSDISGATYSLAAEEQWEFAQFGQRIIATNIDDAVQGATLGPTPTFADLITSTLKPKARHIDTHRDFVVLGNTNDATDGDVPERVWWSAIRNEVDFDPSATTQSDFEDLPEGGWVQRIVGGVDYLLVFLERQIVRMTYVGSPLIFRFDPIDRKRGTPIPGSVIGFGRFVFFISEEGFFVTDGVESTPIGHNKVDREFWDQFSQQDAGRVFSAVDPVNKLVLWNFPGMGASASTPNLLYCYNWVDQRWARVEIDTEVVVRLSSQGYTLDGLDTIGTDIDNATLFPVSFDSRFWTGGQIKLAAFDTSHKVGFFDGTNLAATLETTEFSRGPRSMITSVRPLVDGGTLTSAVASRTKLTDTVTFGSAAAINANGGCSLRSAGRYHRARVSVAAGGTWTKAQGVEITGPPRGRK